MKHYSYDMQATEVICLRDPDEIATRLLSAIDELRRVDPLLADWTFWSSENNWAIDDNGDVKYDIVPVEQARLRMPALVLENVRRDDYGEPDHAGGYLLLASSQVITNPLCLSLNISTGCSWPQENCWQVTTAAYGVPADPSLLAYPIMRGAFLAMLANWPCQWAFVEGIRMEWEDAPGIVGMTKVETFHHRIVWMGYLSAEVCRDFEPPAELMSERTPDEGLLMIATEQTPDPDDPEQMRRANMIGAILGAHYRKGWRERGGPDYQPGGAFYPGVFAMGDDIGGRA